MVHIKITKGLDIPIKGNPTAKIHQDAAKIHISSLPFPEQIGLDVHSFEEEKFRLLVSVGDLVKIGQPVAEDKSTPGRMFVSPACGTIKEIRRGLKRSLQYIIIDVSKQEETWQEFPPINPATAGPQELIDRLMLGGIFTKVRSRPFGVLANPQKKPRNIFVKAIESAPYQPEAEIHVKGHEEEFKAGLLALSKLTDGKVHLVYRQDTTCASFKNAEHVVKHTAEGPHPISSQSLHIQRIDPIRSPDDILWTLSVRDVVSIGHILIKGKYFVDKIITIAGQGILPDRIGYFKAREGYPVRSLVANRLPKGSVRLVSGDPLMGKQVSVDDFLGFDHYVFCAIPENASRELLHFFGIGLRKYSFSKAYLSGHLDNENREYDFTTSMHGEHRAFIDSTLYDKVMPLNIPTMLLVKAIMGEDFELAESYGLLEVDSEDFALPTFVCPSKIEMVDIVRQGLKQFAKEFSS